MNAIFTHTGSALGNWKPLSPARLHHLHLGVAYGVTDIGLVRKTNEDNFLIDEELGLVAVADGMGGHQAGEVASAAAILALRHYIKTSSLIAEGDDDITIPARVSMLLQSPDSADLSQEEKWADQDIPALITLYDAVGFANESIHSRNLSEGYCEGHGMGTTLTGFWQFAPERPLALFHVGDSRIYRYRQNELVLLTRDHTQYQQAVEAGVTINLPKRNILLQAVGPHAAVTPEIKTYQARPGDLYLLCSDGLHGKVPLTAIRDVLGNTHADNMEQSCATLIELANQYEGKDNITAVLVQCR